jgi:hypothetical protein
MILTRVEQVQGVAVSVVHIRSDMDGVTGRGLATAPTPSGRA